MELNREVSWVWMPFMLLTEVSIAANSMMRLFFFVSSMSFCFVDYSPPVIVATCFWKPSSSVLKATTSGIEVAC